MDFLVISLGITRVSNIMMSVLQFGAFPVFVVDGTPSPLKSKARIARFCRASGIDPSSLPAVDDDVSVERNYAFLKCVQECVVSYYDIMILSYKIWLRFCSFSQ